jgi:DinB family protein
MDDAVIRENLVELLQGGHAHAPARQALARVGVKIRTKRPGPGRHSVWELLEHLRIAQEDILRYTLDPAWKSPEFPGGYWPEPDRAVSDRRWSASVSAFLKDLEEACALARDSSRDLTARIPHGEGRTYLRQVLLIADHNAYHLGQIVETRKALGNWAG